MPGRQYSAQSSYRYGFNGKENDNEIKGEGNQQDYGMRIYDPRVGRFLSVDPLQKVFPNLTPYQFASNNPIEAVDLDGREFKVYSLAMNENQGKSQLKLGDFRGVTNIPIQIKATIDFTHTRTVAGVPVTVTMQETFTKQFNLGDLGISPTVVDRGPGQDLKIVPGEMDLNNLPALDDPIWNTLESPEEYVNRFIENANTLIQDIQDARAIIDYMDALKHQSGVNNKLKPEEKKLDPPEERKKRLKQLEKGRPPYDKGLVEKVWKKAKERGGGTVIDPDTGQEIKWDGKKPRKWDMGHIQDKEYWRLVEKYKNGEINWEELKKEYNNADNYQPELPSSNRRKNKKNP